MAQELYEEFNVHDYKEDFEITMNKEYDAEADKEENIFYYSFELPFGYFDYEFFKVYQSQGKEVKKKIEDSPELKVMFTPKPFIRAEQDKLDALEEKENERRQEIAKQERLKLEEETKEAVMRRQ